MQQRPFKIIVYVYVCVHIYVYIYVCVCVCVCVYTYICLPGISGVKNLPAVQEMQVPSWGQEDPLEREMAVHSSILV